MLYSSLLLHCLCKFISEKNLGNMQHAHLPSAEVFFTPKIVGTFYMQGYKVKEKTAIVPHSAALYPQFQNSVGTLELSYDHKTLEH
jgi:hypothetical protein